MYKIYIFNDFCLFYQGHDIHSRARNTFSLTTEPPMSTSEARKSTTSSSDSHTSETTGQLHVTTQGLRTQPHSITATDGQVTTNGTKYSRMAGNMGIEYLFSVIPPNVSGERVEEYIRLN